MHHTPAPKHRVDYFSTSAGRTKYDALRASYLRSINDQNAEPLQSIAASFDYRQAYFIDGGHEGLTGGDSTYHLQTICQTMPQVVGQLRPNCHDFKGLPKSLRPRKTLKFVSDLHGYRYYVGVRGLRDALIAAGATGDTLLRFDAQRQVFDDKFTQLLNAAHIVNEKGENPKVVEQCVGMLIGEMQTLCDWQDGTDWASKCAGNHQRLKDAQRALVEIANGSTHFR
jgi:hypothetical protein